MTWAILFWTAALVVGLLAGETLLRVLDWPGSSRDRRWVRVWLAVTVAVCSTCLAAAVATRSWWPLGLALVTYSLGHIVRWRGRYKRTVSTDTLLAQLPDSLDNGSASDPRKSNLGESESGAGVPPEPSGPGPGGNYTPRTPGGRAHDSHEDTTTGSSSSSGPSLGYSAQQDSSENTIDLLLRRQGEGFKIPGSDAIRRKTDEVWLCASKGPGAAKGRSGTPVRRAGTVEGTREIPGGVADPVHFSVTSAPVMAPNSKPVIDVWAHLGEQRAQVLARAKQKAVGRKVRIQDNGPVQVARGTTLTVHVRIAGLTVIPAQQPILWVGEIGNANFRVIVPADAANGSHEGTAIILTGGLAIATVLFDIEVGERVPGALRLQERQQRYKKAFASYAGQDREHVVEIIRGMQKARPSLNVFVDVADLRSGERWQTRLQEEIVNRDVLYLFWSRAASRSKWVEWEWRCALRERSIDFIDPCPLVSPERVPPPPELESLHFNDRWLAMQLTPPRRRRPS